MITLNDTHTHTHTLGRIPLDEGSAHRSDLYLITNNISKTKTSMPPAGFEPAIPVIARPHLHWTEKDDESTGRGPIWCILPVFGWRDFQEPRKRKHILSLGLNRGRYMYEGVQSVHLTTFRYIPSSCLYHYWQHWKLILVQIWCDFDRASSLICGNKMPTRCNTGFYYRSYCLLNMFRASLCPSSGAQEYYTVVAACGILCCGFFK